MKTFSVWVLALLALAFPAVALDKIVAPGGKTEEGFFIGYERGAIKFMNAEKKTLHLSPSAVGKLILEKPLKARLESKAKRGAMQDVTVTGFEQGQFVFEGLPKMPLYQVSVLRIDSLDMGRSTEDLGGVDIASKGDEVDVASLVVTGKITVVHFHAPGVVSSERQGGFLLRKAEESKGRVVVKRIVVPDNSPVARQYKLEWLPQFWFYHADGRLSSKLSQRFADQDIVDAINKAAAP